jgi:hypothetical protein
MLAQGNALGSGSHELGCALKGRRSPPPPFQGGRGDLVTIPGALPRASYLRAVGATSWPCLHPEKTAKRVL